MRRLILVVLVLCAPAFARQRIFGFCEAGNATVTIGGLTSVTTYQGSYPSATVSVFATGTTNLATIYSDNIGTVKANPFTMTPGDGYWFAYTDNGRYDVKCSGTGIASPFTRGDYLANDPAIALAFSAVSFSATPAFASVSGTVYTMTLTGNVTSSTITGSMTGQVIYFQLCQDGTGSRTFAWPATFLRPPTISSVASSCTVASFYYDGVNWRELDATGDTLVPTSGGISGTWAGSPTWSGNHTFTGSAPITVSGDNPTVLGGSLTAKRVSGVRYADQFAGATPTIQINAAISDCGAYTGAAGNSCLVVIPSTLACGEPSQAPDNVLLIDQRACAQSQGIRYNLSQATAGGVRSKMLLQDNFNASTVGLNPNHNSATMYVYSLPDSPDVTAGTVEAFNGSLGLDSLTGNFTGTAIGIEGEVFCNSLGVAHTATDCRGGTFNALQGNNVSVTNLTSLQAQKVVGSGAGAVNTAVNLKVEATPTVGTATNLGFWDIGNAKIDGTIGSGIAPSASTGIFERHSTLTGTTQFGIQAVPSTSSAATAEGSGGVFRADVAAATTQGINEGVVAQTPSIGAGGVITTWYGFHAQAPPTAGNACSIGLDGSSSGTSCIKPPATGGATNTLPAAAGTISLAVAEYCGATSGATQACAKTVQLQSITVWGEVTLNTATSQSITTLPFTTSTYSCSGSDLTTATGIVSFNTYANASVTIVESGGVNTDHLRWTCTGI